MSGILKIPRWGFCVIFLSKDTENRYKAQIPLPLPKICLINRYKAQIPLPLPKICLINRYKAQILLPLPKICPIKLILKLRHIFQHDHFYIFIQTSMIIKVRTFHQCLIEQVDIIPFHNTL